MSALGQKQTFAVQKATSALVPIATCAVRAKSERSHLSLLVAYKLLASCVASLINEATMLKKVVLAVGLTAIPSIALAQQQQCQLECTWVNQKGEKTKVTRSCHALNASDCTNLGRAETGGNKTCHGNITSNCVEDR